MLYWNRSGPTTLAPVRADIARLAGLALLGRQFLRGGLVGALPFQHAGYAATLPLAALPVALAAVPALDDIVTALRGPA